MDRPKYPVALIRDSSFQERRQICLTNLITADPLQRPLFESSPPTLHQHNQIPQTVAVEAEAMHDVLLNCPHRALVTSTLLEHLKALTPSPF